MVLTEFTEKFETLSYSLYIDLSGKMSHKIGLALPFLTLKSSMANDRMFFMVNFKGVINL